MCQRAKVMMTLRIARSRRENDRRREDVVYETRCQRMRRYGKLRPYHSVPGTCKRRPPIICSMREGLLRNRRKSNHDRCRDKVMSAGVYMDDFYSP